MVTKWGAALLAASTMVAAEVLVPVHNAFGGKAVKRQTANFVPDHQLDMDYAEMESYNSAEKDTIGATVHITTHDPAVQTEDFGGLVTDITCSNDNSMKITFANSDAAEEAKKQWTAPSMTIITLTSTCNEDDERVPWQVSKPVFDGNVATLSGKPSDWDTVSSAMTVDFGNQGNVVNPNAPAAQTNQPSKVRRDDKGLSADLGFKLEDKVIYPPTNVTTNVPGVAMPAIPITDRITQKCKKCVGTGKATFSTGDMSFDIKAAVKDAAKQAEEAAKKGAEAVTSVAVQAVATASAVANQGVASASVVANQGVQGASSVGNAVATKAEEIGTTIATTLSNPFKPGGLFGRDDAFAELAKDLNSGTINMDLTGMGGSFELSTDVYTDKEFIVPLIPGGGITLSPFQIQGILSIGPRINPQLVFKFESEEDLSFNYGFEYKVPEGAGITLNFLDPKASKVNKLADTEFKALPFSSNVKEVAASGLNYSMSFRPVVSVGITVLKNTIDPIELIFNVPKVDGIISIAEDVDEKCKNEGQGDFTAFNVTSSFTFDMGVGSKVNIAAMNLNLDPKKVIVSKTGLFPMNTCVPFHKGKLNLGNAIEDTEDGDEETEDGDEETEDGDEATEDGDEDTEADADSEDADAESEDADADSEDADADSEDADADADSDDADADTDADSEDADADADADSEDADADADADSEDADADADADSEAAAEPTITSKAAASSKPTGQTSASASASASASSPSTTKRVVDPKTRIDTKGGRAAQTSVPAATTAATAAERRHARWFA